MSVPSDWRADALSITCGFETTGDPYMMVAGDFDRMGISCGALQWNIGSNSLQPLIKNVGESVVRAAMPIYGVKMWEACTAPVARGLAIVRTFQGKNAKGQLDLLPAAKAELRALMGTAEVRAQQDLAIDQKAKRAFELAERWAAERDQTRPSKRLYCWMFDIATQNGSLEGQTPKAVAQFIAANRPDKVDDLICDYLKSFKGKGHEFDARRNGARWRDQATGEKLELLCLTYLRAQTSKPQWRHVVINRKGSIAMGSGWVNSGLRDFGGFGL